jgi:hypothetical protein
MHKSEFPIELRFLPLGTFELRRNGYDICIFFRGEITNSDRNKNTETKDPQRQREEIERRKLDPAIDGRGYTALSAKQE